MSLNLILNNSHEAAEPRTQQLWVEEIGFWFVFGAGLGAGDRTEQSQGQGRGQGGDLTSLPHSFKSSSQEQQRVHGSSHDGKLASSPGL